MPPGGWPSIGSVMTKLCAASGKTLPDLSGHPQYLVDGWQPMKELV